MLFNGLSNNVRCVEHILRLIEYRHPVTERDAARTGICLRCQGNDDDNDSDDSDTCCNDDTLSRRYYRVTLSYES